MPPIYGGSRTRDSLREEEMAEASFEQSDKWMASTHSAIAVGVIHVSVRREPRGWVGVIIDMDVAGARSGSLAPSGREVWRSDTVWIGEMTALDVAERYARRLYPAWTRDREYGFHTCVPECAHPPGKGDNL